MYFKIGIQQEAGITTQIRAASKQLKEIFIPHKHTQKNRERECVVINRATLLKRKEILFNLHNIPLITDAQVSSRSHVLRVR